MIAQSLHPASDEILFRRIPVSKGWYDPDSGRLEREAFAPTRFDTTGLSVTRARSKRHPKFLSISEAAVGKSRQGYFIAILGVADVTRLGMTVIADPLPENPGHAEIPEISYAQRHSDVVIQLTMLLAAQAVRRVEGPFHTDS